jgi:hypothetical protein
MRDPRISSAVAIEGQLPELPDYLKKNLRRGDAFIQLTVSAVHKALSLVPDTAVETNETALFLGTCFGPMQCNFDVLDALVDGDPVSPTLFSHSVFNAAAGYVSRLFTIYGGAWTITSFSWPFLTCLENALMFLNTGRISRAIVIHVETYSPLLLDAGQKMSTETASWNPGAVAWILDRSTSAGQKCCLAGVKVDENQENTGCYLERNEHITSRPDTILNCDPMALSRYLTDLVTSTEQAEKQTVTVGACFGSAAISFRTVSI